MKFKLTIRKRIHSCFAGASSGDVTLERSYKLPFPPVVGLWLKAGEWSDKIEELHYDIDSGEFLCWVEADKEYYNRGLEGGSGFEFRATKEMMDSKVKEYLEEGWGLRER